MPGWRIPGRGRLLVVHQAALGDLILALWALRDVLGPENLAQAFLVCQGTWMPLAREVFGFARAFPVESAWFSSLFSQPDRRALEVLSSLDGAVLFSGSRELGESFSRFGPPFIRASPRPPVNLRVHVAEHLRRELSESLFGKASEAIPSWKSLSAGTPSPLFPSRIVLHPGAGSPRKRWHLDRFLDLFQLLQSRGQSPVFVLGPAETCLWEKLTAAGVDRDCLVLPSDVGGLARLLREAGGFVGNDSGVAHLAGFLGVPTVTVFGPSDPVRWSPLGPRSVALRAPTDCEPCFEKQKIFCQAPVCLFWMDPGQVLEALEGLVPLNADSL
ncbi:MAG: glycosyltransferase family 9 protein [Pseudomonadota bacterium]